MKEDRMGLTRVRAPEEDQVGLFDLAVGTRSAPGSEHCRQTDDTGRMSSSVAAVDVVAADDRTDELLRDEIHLVGRLGAAEAPERVGPAPDRLTKSRGGGVERHLPGRRLERAVHPNKRRRQPPQVAAHLFRSSIGRVKMLLCSSTSTPTWARGWRRSRPA